MPPVKSALRVVGFCAAWCHTCGDFRTTFERLAGDRPHADFVWLDIEDDADLAGDIDVDDFPTIAIYEDHRLVHFGVTLPQPGVVGRLIDSFGPTSPTLAGPDALVALSARLMERT